MLCQGWIGAMRKGKGKKRKEGNREKVMKDRHIGRHAR
jgi:hypothetical protein